MFNIKRTNHIIITTVSLLIVGCKVPALNQKQADIQMPSTYSADVVSIADTLSWGGMSWRQFFKDPNLIRLIDSALVNNKELKVTLQEIEIAKNEATFRKSKIYPRGGINLSSDIEKVGRYTSQGAGDASTEISQGHEVPDPLGNFGIVASASWEVDIWHKLRNAQYASVNNYLATIEGKNFVLSNLIAEISSSYYELLMFDNQLAIVDKNILLQKRALEIVKFQKEAGKVNELAVQKFSSELLKTESVAYKIRQNIVEIENKINFLLGRYLQNIPRDKDGLLKGLPNEIRVGIPSQLLHNRPDLKEAELELTAANLDVKVARAEFFPSLDISAAIGLEAFKPSYLFKMPESMLYSLAGDLFAPIINRAALKAEFNTANAKQLQSLYNYEQKVLNAYFEVANQMANISNLEKQENKISQQVDILNNSVTIANELFVNNRAEYLEVLTTQREVLDAQLDFLELKKSQYDAVIKMYKALGGGWK